MKDNGILHKLRSLLSVAIASASSGSVRISAILAHIETKCLLFIGQLGALNVPPPYNSRNFSHNAGLSSPRYKNQSEKSLNTAQNASKDCPCDAQVTHTIATMNPPLYAHYTAGKQPTVRITPHVQPIGGTLYHVKGKREANAIAKQHAAKPWNF